MAERTCQDEPTGKAFFVSEQRKPLHRSTVNLLLRKYSAAASLPLLVHPHMLRHACGFALADQGADTRLIQDYLGHRNIQHTGGVLVGASNAFLSLACISGGSQTAPYCIFVYPKIRIYTNSVLHVDE